jgi:hypothetical protein
MFIFVFQFYSFERIIKHHCLHGKKIEWNLWVVIKVYLLTMTYQPFSLIMPEVPAYMSDGEIARFWGQNPYIRSIQMEPYVKGIDRYNRVTIHFEHFGDNELRQKITNGFYKTTAYDLTIKRPGQLDFSSLLLPCESSNPPRNEYSHIVVFQLQDIVSKQAKQIQDLESGFDNQLQAIVSKQAAQIHNIESRLDLQYQSTIRKQTEHIQRLECRLQEMETKIHEVTDLYVDINQSYTGALEQFETRLREQDAYCKCLEERIMDTTDILNNHIEHSYRANKLFDELKQETKALTEWCSRPIWNRTAAFNYEKEPEYDFTSEF